MRVGFFPFVRVGLLGAGALLLLRIALPGLIRLCVRSLISFLPGIVEWGFIAHEGYLQQKKSPAFCQVPTRGSIDLFWRKGGAASHPERDLSARNWPEPASPRARVTLIFRFACR